MVFGERVELHRVVRVVVRFQGLSAGGLVSTASLSNKGSSGATEGTLVDVRRGDLHAALCVYGHRLRLSAGEAETGTFTADMK